MNYYLSKLITYHEVHKMYREGSSIRKISDHLGLNWRTVKKLLTTRPTKPRIRHQWKVL
ncbi:hypothetical protein [Sphingobacterium chuzhouense]|uniref:Transposase IS30-like HTH domain-containing protein n=1 Tax=Sphingobacterium chuzhouense TaxID=1742264 RepID=A0ABR7XU72_9SPHI|nr:hypothetical protein [Sphingobacterium chuzhouense]MBD1422592.1 hypothetical protein [Sphingobacterium chuzhouense]